MKTYKPLGNRVLVKRKKIETSKGGIFLPESAQEKPKEGEIISCGSGRLNKDGSVEPMTVKKGDKVMFSSYAGTEVKDVNADDQFLIISEDDLLGIIEG